MKRPGHPNNGFVCEVLAIDFGVGRQGMIFGQRGKQLIVPNAVRFETRCVGWQLNDSRLEHSFEEQFDLGRRIGAVQCEPRSRHSFSKFGLESDEQRWPEPRTIADGEYPCIATTCRVTAFHCALEIRKGLPGLSHESRARSGQNNL